MFTGVVTGLAVLILAMMYFAAYVYAPLRRWEHWTIVVAEIYTEGLQSTHMFPKILYWSFPFAVGILFNPIVGLLFLLSSGCGLRFHDLSTYAQKGDHRHDAN